MVRNTEKQNACNWYPKRRKSKKQLKIENEQRRLHTLSHTDTQTHMPSHTFTHTCLRL